MFAWKAASAAGSDASAADEPEPEHVAEQRSAAAGWGAASPDYPPPGACAALFARLDGITPAAPTTPGEAVQVTVKSTLERLPPSEKKRRVRRAALAPKAWHANTVSRCYPPRCLASCPPRAAARSPRPLLASHLLRRI